MSGRVVRGNFVAGQGRKSTRELHLGRLDPWAFSPGSVGIQVFGKWGRVDRMLSIMVLLIVKR
jgi:hypothetical protein